MSEPGLGRSARVVLACKQRPPSVNNATGKGKESFGAALAACHKAAGAPRQEGLLYGVVCWFVRGYRPALHPDADNISKTVWDMLSARRGNDVPDRLRLGAFGDDKQVRLRLAGIFDFGREKAGAPSFEVLDLTGLPDDVGQALDDLLEEKPDAEHLTYIEFGPLRADLFALPLSKGAR